MSLRTYRAKRRFDVTPEPRGKARDARAAKEKPRRFVVHKHRASHLHYDLRLETGGVLRSWAVPKGPSLDPSVKRLAMAVEDHPVEYAEFEGTIPEGEYGGGTMMLWDRGTWQPDEDEPVAKSVARGELKFTLHGEKLRGSWVLVRTGGRGGERADRSWLLIKHRDDAASEDDVADTQPYSVATGRLLAQIAHDEGGDVAKAASADPPRAVERLLADLGKERKSATAKTKAKPKPATAKPTAARAKRTTASPARRTRKAS